MTSLEDIEVFFARRTASMTLNGVTFSDNEFEEIRQNLHHLITMLRNGMKEDKMTELKQKFIVDPDDKFTGVLKLIDLLVT